MMQLLVRQQPAPATAGLGPKPQDHSQMIASTARRSASGLRRLLCARDVSRSGPSRPRSGMPSTAGTPDDARAPAAALSSLSSTVSEPNPAAPRAAPAPHRSSAEPSPQTPPGNPPGSVICNWQTGDILIGRLQAVGAAK